MPDTFTPSLNLTLPEVGGSSDTWGTKLNEDLTAVDALFGTGPVLLLVNGGTGAATASLARTNLGLDTMATQAASAVDIEGGTAVLEAVRVSANAVAYELKELDAAVDHQSWGLAADGAVGSFRLYADDFSSSAVVWQVTRTALAPLAMNVLTELQVNGIAVWHGSNDGAGSTLDADLLDGQEGSFYQNAANLNAGTIPAARVGSSSVTQHQASLAILETQITNGTILARLGSTETVTGLWSYAERPRKTGQGGFLSNALVANASGRITLSDTEPASAAAIGSPGDMVFEY